MNEIDLIEAYAATGEGLDFKRVYNKQYSQAAEYLSKLKAEERAKSLESFARDLFLVVLNADKTNVIKEVLDTFEMYYTNIAFDAVDEAENIRVENRIM